MAASATAACCSTSSVGRIAKGTEQQRHMEMLASILNRKRDLNRRVKRRHAKRGKVGSGVESQAIGAGSKCCAVGEQITQSSSAVGMPCGERHPSIAAL